MQQVEKIIRTYRSLIISGAILVFCSLGVVFALVPAGKKAVEHVSKMSALNAEVAELRGKLSLLESLDAETLRQDLSGLLSAVPADKSLSTLFATVDGITAQSGVVLVDMSVRSVGSVATASAAQASALEKQMGARLVSFSLTIEGSVDNLRQFVSLIGGVRRMLRISSFSVAFSSSGRSPSVTLEMEAFYESLPTELGAVGKGIVGLTEGESETITQVNNLPLIAPASAFVPSAAAMPPKSNPFGP